MGKITDDFVTSINFFTQKIIHHIPELKYMSDEFSLTYTKQNIQESVLFAEFRAKYISSGKYSVAQVGNFMDIITNCYKNTEKYKRQLNYWAEIKVNMIHGGDNLYSEYEINSNIDKISILLNEQLNTFTEVYKDTDLVAIFINKYGTTSDTEDYTMLGFISMISDKFASLIVKDFDYKGFIDEAESDVQNEKRYAYSKILSFYNDNISFKHELNNLKRGYIREENEETTLLLAKCKLEDFNLIKNERGTTKIIY